MPVYVDDLAVPYGRMRMSHMIADTDEELHAMAQKVGVSRRHWQSPDKHSISHYDVCQQSKQRALAEGAVAITAKQAAAMSRRFAQEGVLGLPEDALAWYIEWHKSRHKPPLGQ